MALTTSIGPFSLSKEVLQMLTRRDSGSIAPIHFLRELTKTPEGCMYLHYKMLVPEYAQIVRIHGMEAEEQAILTNVKSVLWALVGGFLKAV